jgi:hypothetical protein
MSWKFKRIYFVSEKGGHDLCIIEDENEKVVCRFEREITDSEGRMFAKSPDMFKAIEKFIEGVEHGKLRPAEACKRFKTIVSNIKG